MKQRTDRLGKKETVLNIYKQFDTGGGDQYISDGLNLKDKTLKCTAAPLQVTEGIAT